MGDAAVPVVLAPVNDAVVGAAGDGEAAAAAVANIVGNLADPVAQRVADLEERRRALVQGRKAVQKDLRNEQRKKRRLLDKAKTLSDGDLLQVIATRAKAKSVAEAKAKAKAKADPKKPATPAQDEALFDYFPITGCSEGT